MCSWFCSGTFVTVIVSQPMNLVKTIMFGLIGIVLGYMYKTRKASGNLNSWDACILNWFCTYLCCEYKVFQHRYNEANAKYI